MNDQKSPARLDLSSRIRRSQGRSGRTIAATAKVTYEEHGELAKASQASGQALGEWAREVLLREARRDPDDALFTELVATRLLLTNLIKPLLLGKPMPEDWITKAMAGVRDVKHKAAADLRKEYEARARKES